jgi:hypothetical protein
VMLANALFDVLKGQVENSLGLDLRCWSITTQG